MTNAVLDFANLARNVQLPFDKNGSSNAPQAVSIKTETFQVSRQN